MAPEYKHSRNEDIGFILPCIVHSVRFLLLIWFVCQKYDSCSNLSFQTHFFEFVEPFFVQNEHVTDKCYKGVSKKSKLALKTTPNEFGGSNLATIRVSHSHLRWKRQKKNSRFFQGFQAENLFLQARCASNM